MNRVIALIGIPGSGKTTLAADLSERLHRPVFTAGDLARALDPGALARGDLADEATMRAAFVAAMAEWSDREFILDGWPRNQPQSLLLPDDTKTILLTCRPDIARDRLYRRGREDDQFAEKRIREQGDLLQIDIAGGWVFKFVGWEGAINTTYRTRQDVARSVYRYLIGEKGQAFDG